MNFEPNDSVVVKQTGQTGKVTYPGRNGFPGRVYVMLDTKGSPLTVHYSPSELEKTNPEIEKGQEADGANLERGKDES